MLKSYNCQERSIVITSVVTWVLNNPIYREYLLL